MDYKFGTLTRTVAPNFDFASVKFHQVFDYCQSQSQATVFAGRATIALAESFKDNRKQVRGDSFTVVGNDELRGRTSSPQTNLNGPTGMSEFDSVGKQVPTYLLQAAGVRSHSMRSWFYRNLKMDRLSLRSRPHHFKRGLDNRAETGWPNVESQSARYDSGNVKQI